jgi:hypothetical protein
VQRTQGRKKNTLKNLLENQEGKTNHGWPSRRMSNITKIHTEYRHVPTYAALRFLEVRRESDFAQVVIKFMADYICVYTCMLRIYSAAYYHTLYGC